MCIMCNKSGSSCTQFKKIKKRERTVGIFKKKNKSASQACLDAAAHIKPNTLGTSNEISLSVLDAASEKSDEQLKAESRAKSEAVEVLGSAEESKIAEAIEAAGATDAAQAAKAPSTHEETAPSTPAKAAEQELISAKSAQPATTAPPAPAASSAPAAPAASSAPAAPAATKAQATSTFSQNLNSSFAAEVASKKAKRRKNKAVLTAIICLILAAIVAVLVLAYFAYTARVNDFASSYNAAIDGLAQTDETLAGVNEILENPTSQDSRRLLGSIQTNIKTSKAALSECEVLLSPVEEKAMLPSEKEKAYQLKNSLEARQDMLNTGEQMIAQLKTAIEAIDLLESSKAKVDAAITKEQNAASLIANPTTENLNAAKAAIDEATANIDSAISTFEESKKACAEADLSNYSQYLQSKKEALSQQGQAVQAILDEDTQRARDCQTAYETADAQAKSSASKIEYIADPVLGVYKNKTADISKEYEAARTQVAAADEYLRANM